MAAAAATDGDGDWRSVPRASSPRQQATTSRSRSPRPTETRVTSGRLAPSSPITVPAGWSAPHGRRTGRRRLRLARRRRLLGWRERTAGASVAGNVITITDRCHGKLVDRRQLRKCDGIPESRPIRNSMPTTRASGIAALKSGARRCNVTAPPTGTVKVIKTRDGGRPEGRGQLHAQRDGHAVVPPLRPRLPATPRRRHRRHRRQGLLDHRRYTRTRTTRRATRRALRNGRSPRAATVTCTVTNAYTPVGTVPARKRHLRPRGPPLRDEPGLRPDRLPPAERPGNIGQDVFLHDDREPLDSRRGRPRARDSRSTGPVGSAHHAPLRAGQSHPASRLRPLSAQPGRGDRRRLPDRILR